MDGLTKDQIHKLAESLLDTQAQRIVVRARSPEDLRAGVQSFYDCIVLALIEEIKAKPGLADYLFDVALRLHERCIAIVQTTVKEERSKNAVNTRQG